MIDIKIKLTTTSKPSEYQMLKVKKIEKNLNLLYVERKNNTISQMLKINNCSYFVVVKKDKIVITDGVTELFWHPNMALLKIKSLKNGQIDPIIKAMDLKSDAFVLDCTLGFATDALVIAAYIGNEGKVVGTETNKYIAYLTKDGLNNYTEGMNDLKSIIKKIDVINIDYNEYLKSLKDNSFDVVYFDPMFKSPNKKSSFMNSLRPFAEHSYITKDVLCEALRVARKRVVAKDRMFSKELELLGFTEFYGSGARGSAKYGAIIK